MQSYRRVSIALLALCLSWAIGCGRPEALGAQKSKSAGPTPAWSEMKSIIEQQWKNSYPKEKILGIEKKGEPEFTQEAGKTETIWDWDWESASAVTIKGREGSYLRQTALVTVERANKTRARFTVAVLYKYAGNRWLFAEMPMGANIEELPGADSPSTPPDDEAIQIFTEAWKKMRPDFDVSSITVLSKPEFHHYGSKYWLTYKLEVNATGTRKGERERFGKKYKCAPNDFSSVLKWDAEKKAWGADEEMIKNFNESGCDEAL